MAKEISNKRETLVGLGDEVSALIRHLERLQAQLSTNSAYSADRHTSDLDHSIAAVSEAEEKLGAICQELVNEYHIDEYNGSY